MKIVSILLILFACGLTGCKATQAVETPSQPSSAGHADPRAEVIAASKKLAALPQLSAIVEGKGKLGLRKDVEYIAPDRYHIKFDDATGAHVEMINIGKETYIRNGDSWDLVPGNDPPPTPTFRNNFTDDVLDSIANVKYQGEETLNGKPAYVYGYNLVTKVGNFKIFHTIWVDQVSGIPLKSVAEYTNESQEDTLTTSFDSLSPVSIEVPAKGKVNSDTAR